MMGTHPVHAASQLWEPELAGSGMGMCPSSFGRRAHQEKQSVFNARITLPAHKSRQTEQDNLLSRIPQLLNGLQAALPAEYNVLAELVSLPPVFTFCHNNFDNFSDRKSPVSAYSLRVGTH